MQGAAMASRLPGLQILKKHGPLVRRVLLRSLAVGFLAAVRDARGERTAIVRLNPLLIGSLFPSHGEDRLIVAPDEIPPLLTDTLKAVEDQRFDSHLGIDPIAVARAMFVNVKSGEIREG